MMRFTTCGLAALCFLTVAAEAASDQNRYLNLVAKRKYADVVTLLDRSAKAGNAEAQFRLAVMLRSGLGSKRDEARARRLLKASAASGHAQAKVLLGVLTKLVTTGQQPVAPKPTTRTAEVAVVRKDKTAFKTDLAFAASRPFSVVTVPGGGASAAIVTDDLSTPLILAARSGNARLAQGLANPAALDTADKAGRTALSWAVRNGQTAVIELLLEKGASPVSAQSPGAGAADLAARQCQAELSMRLAHSGSEDEFFNQAKLLTSFCPGATWFTGKIAEAAMASPEKGAVIVALAIERSNRDLVDALLALGVDPDLPLPDGNRPLTLAAAQKDATLFASLLGAGGNPEETDADGNTPLIIAAARGVLPVVKQLIANAGDINHKNAEGKTALYVAVEALNVEAVRLIAAAGGAVTSRSIARDTPEKLAERLGRSDIQLALQGQ